MDILENALPNYWQDKMQHQSFDCTVKGQSKLISFCENLEALDPNRKVKEGHKKTQEDAEVESIAKANG
eukprot:15212657-Ditylum_brightwellii.AAC.1